LDRHATEISNNPKPESQGEPGFVYASFILDLHSRMIAGWQVADTLRAEPALDALEMAIWSRGDRIDGQLVHHSDRGVQPVNPLY